MQKTCLTFSLVITLVIGLPEELLAERETVLKQIDVPHNYYYREMYLPQLTSGPSSLTWSPDGTALIYSMQGSLWRQDIETEIAEQLTAGPGYDYQPDWSPDGRNIAFVRYQGDAVELHTLNLATGNVSALTNEGTVNLEPRWSPDGSRLAFVSTRDTGRFHVFVGDVAEDRLIARQLVAERQSKVPRYYYSSYDHELSPVWSPDGSQIVYVGNHEIPYGTGGIWRWSMEDDAEPQLIRLEETSWRARPDWSPDGKRIVYASYLGRQWHQLWVTTTEGNAEPFPLTYGDFDIASPRWSPDGKQIAYITNESGNLEIRIQDLIGGKTTRLKIAERHYINPVASLQLRVVNQDGRPVAARVAVVAADGRSYAPETTWIHADDGFDRGLSEFEIQYFHLDGEASLALPVGPADITVWRGMEHEVERVSINLSPGEDNALTVVMRAVEPPVDWTEWVSGDVHVHMNYGGTYRNTPTRLALQAGAEDLDVVFNLIVNKEQRIPDISYFSSQPDAASDDDILIMHAQEFHTSFWGHIGIIGLKSHLLLPDYSSYPGTAAASIYPDNATISRLAHEQGALVGYVHPFEPPAPNPATDASLTNSFPVDVALGLVDYFEVVGFADPRTSADVWYGLLNCGMRVAAAGGTDAMANYASLRGPIGINRTYAHIPGGISIDPVERQEQWLHALKSGKTIATNGPLVGLTVNGDGPGAGIDLGNGPHEISFEGFLRSIVPIDHLELVMNGVVIRTFSLNDSRKAADLIGTVQIDRSGWLLLRAWNESAHPLVFDLYPYATTSPIYVSVGDEAPRSEDNAEYFIAWIERIRNSVETHDDFNDDAERQSILTNLELAERRFEACR